MAIRPEISLQAGKIPQDTGIVGGIERGMKLQQLAMQPAILEQQLSTARQAELTARQAELASRASTAVTEAQLPGVRAEATQKTRALVEFPEWMAKNAGQFIDPKTMRIDTGRFQEAATRDGFAQEGLKYAGEQLGVVKQQIDNAKTEQEKAVAANTARNLAVTTIGNILQATPEQDQLKVLNALSGPLENILPGMGADVRGMFVTEDKDKGTTRINKNIVLAARTAGMTPEQQDANTRAFAMLDPEFKAKLENVIPGRERTTMILDAEEKQGVVDLNKSGIDSIPGFLKEVKLPGRPGAIAEDLWNKYVAQGGDAAKIQAALNAYNARTGQKLSFRDGMDAVKAVLEQENSILLPKIKTQIEFGKGGMINPAGQPTQNTKEKPGAPLPKPQIPTVKSVEEARALPPGTRFMTPDGRIKVR
jgi:hypothetical protein